MHARFRHCACALLLALAGVAAPAAADPHSYAEPQRLRVTELAIDLELDFTARRLRGHVDLTVERLDPTATELLLDTRELDIARVRLLEPAASVASLAHSLDAADPILGQALRIELPATLPAKGVFKVRVEYATRPEASALQWLEPAQTSGSQPYVYSQSQAIHARSWLPVPDSPGIRMRYTARLRVPPALIAVMSAARVETSPATAGEFHFAMRQPVPAYLIAFAVGDLRFQALDARTGVWAEPAMLAAATHEFADLPAMLEACERRFGPYRWERYDVLVMPRSFPYGGMENPRLSFISPSLVAGDRSLVSTVAHELAHSWSGNLVTNATWDDFWLNEGFTTYLERRILEMLFGERRAQMEDAIGAAFMRQAIADAIADGRARDTALVLDLAGRDPDEGSSDIAYEKGRWFLGWLEQRYGRATLDALLREWFDTHAFGSVTTPEFVGHLQRFLRARGLVPPPPAELGEWLHGTGLPASAPLPPNEAFAEVDRAREDWLAGRLALEALPAKRWSTQEWQRFLDELPADLDHTRVAALRERFGLGPQGNAEIARSWCALVIRTAYAPGFGDVERFLNNTGRYRLVVTLYRDLARTPAGLELGRRIFAQARAGYHASIRSAVERELKLDDAAS